MHVRQYLVFKIILMSVAMVLLTTSFFVAQAYHRGYQALEERFGQSLKGIVATAALQIDGDEHRKIRTKSDASGPEFQKIRDELKKVQEANGLRLDLLYTFNFVTARELRFAVMLQEPYTGDPYTIVPQNFEKVLAMMREGKAVHTSLYEDKHGAWVSAYAPIRDKTGAIVGMLEADYEVSAFKQALMEEEWWLVECSVVALVLAMFGSLFLAQGIKRALEKIRIGAEEIAQANYRHRIDLQRSDELGLVARQFNKMAEILFERFHLLKFLPKHTIDAISKMASKGERADTERVDATIFFSDIRGYTSMSGSFSDEKIVSMLNAYLRRQAELIEEQQGTIDKFIGDAVLAVFTGDRHEIRAIAAAKAIQRAVMDMNAAKAFEQDVHIGIGLASGVLVFGEIGSAERRERTIIGSVVNLASRLCSQAGAEEILISEELYKRLEGAVAILGSRMLELKGFNETQLVRIVALS